MVVPKRPPTSAEFRDLVEGADYVWEGSSVVLTTEFLRSLGKCCQMGCRNCPWRLSRSGASAQLGGRSVMEQVSRAVPPAAQSREGQGDAS